LCLTDLARAGWELHLIATFAGHRSTQTTLQYIHLSGRELAIKLQRSMAEVHAQRVAQLARPGRSHRDDRPNGRVIVAPAAQHRRNGANRRLAVANRY
jgi:integrase/recombinase XerD